MFCNAFQWHIPTPPQGDYFTIIVDLLRPVSPAGEVRLRSADDDIVMNGDGMKDLVGEDYPWPMPRASNEAMNRTILERS